MKNSKQTGQKKNIHPSSNRNKSGVPDKEENDKTGTDKDADSTKIEKEPDKFEKPKRETDPDTTEIDKDADKTKIEK